MRIFLPLAAALFMLAGCNSTPLPDTCYVQPSSGKCKAAFMRYYFDAGANTCKGFIWGGCEGTVPFETMTACHTQCMPGQPLPEQPVLKQQAPAPTQPAPELAPESVPGTAP